MIRENTKVIKRPGDTTRIICDEDYAQELYDRMFNLPVSRKDFVNGELLRVTSMKINSNDEIEVTCNDTDTLYFDLKKERKFMSILGFDDQDFRDWISSGEADLYIRDNFTCIEVENASQMKGSLYQAHLRTIVTEFKNQIAKPTRAYVAKVIDKNQGGFIVEVQGIRAFMPGSLAAANKITDFDTYIGKEIYVMIEDYLQGNGMFVVSYKKYLETILPSRLSELERNQRLTGTVTGTSKYGIFVEFDEVFTGLLHTAEMSPETLDKFSGGEYRAGDDISVWLKDIRDNKLILTENDPSIRQNEMEEIRERVEGNMILASIVSIKPHGALMEIEKGVLGLLPLKEMKKSGRRLNVGEEMEIFIKRVDTTTGKIYLTLSDERIASEV